MKKQLNLIGAAMLTVATAGFAQPSNDFKYKVSEIGIQSFTQLTVNANIDVVLVQNDSLHTAYVEGDEKLTKDIKLSMKEGELVVSSARNISYKEKIQVTIPVNQLEKVELNGNSGAYSVNVIKANHLVVLVNNDCNVRLKATGTIGIETADNCYIQYHKESKFKLADVAKSN